MVVTDNIQLCLERVEDLLSKKDVNKQYRVYIGSNFPEDLKEKNSYNIIS